MLKLKLLLPGLIVFLGLSSLSFQVAYAQDCDNPRNAAEAIRCGSNEVGGEEADPEDINVTIERVLNIASVIIGVIAVVMIMIGGFRYITSAGDANRTKAAKDTLLYAVIGLIIVALAQFIVRFVISNVAE